MKHTKFLTTKKLLLLAGILPILGIIAIAQVNYSANGVTKLSIKGTSTLHDWEMTSKAGKCDAVFTFNSAGQITGLSSLSFSTPVGDLKSGKGAMDKNAYKALKKDKYATISYVGTSATVTTTDKVNYTIKSHGKLTIAGTTLDIDLVANGKMNADKSITVEGNYKMKMKDYKVEPPSFMFGTVTTGNEITLSYELTIKK
jgi:polyisoprenoid-binding protein YceI